MVMLCRQKDTDAARRKKTGRPIFRTIFSAMMLVTLVEVVLHWNRFLLLLIYQ